MTKKIVSLTFIDDGDDLTDAAVLKALKRVKKLKKKSEISKKKDKIVKKSLENGLLSQLLMVIKGGPGSGHFGHAGDPPNVGGSVPGSIGMSVFTGKHARTRQWLRSQGLSKVDADAIVASGAADANRAPFKRDTEGDIKVKPLSLVGHRGGLAKIMGEADAINDVRQYNRGLITRDTLIERLGGDPLQTSLPGKIAKLGDFEQRIARGKLQTGDELQWVDPDMPEWLWGPGAGPIPYKVIEVDSDGWALIEDPEGDSTWFTPSEVRKRFQEGYLVPFEGKFPNPVQYRLEKGKLNTGDIVDIAGEPYEVINVFNEEIELINVGGKRVARISFRGYELQEEIEIGGIKAWEGKTPPGPLEMELQTSDGAWKPFPGAAAESESTEFTMMREGHIEVVSYPPEGVSQTYEGLLEDGTRVLVKETSPYHVGENVSEVAVYDLAHRLGYEDMVTPAAIRSDTGEVVRVFAPGDSMNHLMGSGELREYGSLVDESDFTRLGILDAVMGGTDRHGGNVVITQEGRVIAIDNDFGFAGGGWLGEGYDEVASVDLYLSKAVSRWTDVTGEYELVFDADELIRASALRFDSSFEQYLKSVRGDEEWDRVVARLIAIEKYARTKQDANGDIYVS